MGKYEQKVKKKSEYPQDIREILETNWSQIELPPDEELKLMEETLKCYRKGDTEGAKALIRRRDASQLDFPYEIDPEIVSKLKPLQLTFFERRAVLLYCISGDLMWSLRTAGYKKPHMIRAGFLQKKAVREAMEIIDLHLTSASIADAKEVREFWTQTMNDDSVALSHRIKVSDLLAKSHGLFIEKIQIEQRETKAVDVKISFAHLPPGALGRSLGLDQQPLIEASTIEIESLDDIM